MKIAQGVAFVALIMGISGYAVANDGGGKKNRSLLWKVSTSMSSKFIGYIGYRLSDDPVVQTEVSVVTPRGWKAGVWWSTGTDDAVFSSNTADEIQWTLGWTRTFASKTTIATEVVYMDFMPLDRAKKDVITPRIRFGMPLPEGIWGAPTLTVQAEDRFSIPSRKERPTFIIGLSDRVRLSDRWTVNAGGSALSDTGSATADEGVLVQWKGELAWQCNDHVSAQLFVKYFDPIDIDPPDKRKEEFVVGAGITITF